MITEFQHENVVWGVLCFGSCFISYIVLIMTIVHSFSRPAFFFFSLPAMAGVGYIIWAGYKFCKIQFISEDGIRYVRLLHPSKPGFIPWHEVGGVQLSNGVYKVFSGHECIAKLTGFRDDMEELLNALRARNVQLSKLQARGVPEFRLPDPEECNSAPFYQKLPTRTRLHPAWVVNVCVTIVATFVAVLLIDRGVRTGPVLFVFCLVNWNHVFWSAEFNCYIKILPEGLNVPRTFFRRQFVPWQEIRCARSYDGSKPGMRLLSRSTGRYLVTIRESSPAFLPLLVELGHHDIPRLDEIERIPDRHFV